jgi:hypothetical protein
LHFCQALTWLLEKITTWLTTSYNNF